MAITSYTIPSLADIRDRMLEDIRRQFIAAGVSSPDISKGSERWVRAEALAAAVLEAYAREVAYQDATMPDTATGDDLTRLADLEGVTISSGAGASGYIILEGSGSISVDNGKVLTAPDGLRYQTVLASPTSFTSGAAIPIAGVDTGVKTNKPAGTVLTWASPPTGASSTARVGYDGLRFGEDEDTEYEIQQNIQDRRRHPVGGGNWAQVAKDAKEASKSIEQAFVYPAVYGPSTQHVAVCVGSDENFQYTREPSAALLLLAATAISNNHPEHAHSIVTGVTDLETDLVLKVTLPEPRAGGGLGGGWVDTTTYRWPDAFNSTAPYAVTLTATPTNPKIIQVSAETEPVDLAHIGIWSSSTKTLMRTRVKSHASAGADTWDIVLYDAIDTTKASLGDFVMPDADKLDVYMKTLAGAFGKLGAGQKWLDALTLPRSYRRPLVEESWPSSFSSIHVGQLSVSHPEMINILLQYWEHSEDDGTVLPVTCPTPTGTDAPYILIPGKLALYP